MRTCDALAITVVCAVEWRTLRSSAGRRAHAGEGTSQSIAGVDHGPDNCAMRKAGRAVPTGGRDGRSGCA